MIDPLPPPLSRAHRKHYEEDARALKSDLDALLAEVDEVLVEGERKSR